MTREPCKIVGGKPEADCTFREALRDNQDGYASIMYKQSIQQVYNNTVSYKLTKPEADCIFFLRKNLNIKMK